MILRSVIAGVGACLPERILTNADLETMVETNDAWIVERTGIKTRHIAADGELTSDLAAAAAAAALHHAGLAAHQVDLLILATSTPDETIPSTAVKVQHKIGMTCGAAFDLNAACSGFVYGLTVADQFIRSGSVRHAVVIGAETFSRLVDWTDRGTCILFGDGAGAVVLSASEGRGDASDRGILHATIHSDGAYVPMLKTTGGVSSTQRAGVLIMEGREVFKHATVKMADAVNESMKTLDLPMESIDWVVPHQANIRILESTAKKLHLPASKLVTTVEIHGNTSAASIPLGLAHLARDGRLKKGQLVATPALGAGLTWGNCIIRW